MRYSVAMVRYFVGLLLLLPLAGCGGEQVPPLRDSLVLSSPDEAASDEVRASWVDTGPGSVIRVIDGDTFEISTGEKVRVLGIDSCERGTPGGRQATEAARTLIDSYQGVVGLSAEAGVDRDRNGRLLRYVTLGTGRDFGEAMVRFSHTSIYRGRNDASPAYMTELRAEDVDGRACNG